MDLPTVGWHIWERTELRMLQVSRYESFEKVSREVFSERGVFFPYLSGTQEFFLHRLTLLTWIGELELAKKLWEDERSYFWGMDFEDVLFRILICEETFGSGHIHPEFRNLVEYRLLGEEDAFKLSTTPISKLLKMDKPHFSSVDGLIAVDFDKHELERVAEIVPEKFQKELRLPIILLRKKDKSGCVKSFMTVGNKLENMLVQKLLKLTEEPFRDLSEVEEKRELTSISMFGRRKFKTIYKVLPESSTIWLSASYQHPHLRS